MCNPIRTESKEILHGSTLKNIMSDTFSSDQVLCEQIAENTASNIPNFQNIDLINKG